MSVIKKRVQCFSFANGSFYTLARFGLFAPNAQSKLQENNNNVYDIVQLKYKRRVYKMLHLDEKQLRSLHTRVNLRRFFDYVTSGQTEKITKMCAKGLDPNIHCQDTGGESIFFFPFLLCLVFLLLEHVISSRSMHLPCKERWGKTCSLTRDCTKVPWISLHGAWGRRRLSIFFFFLFYIFFFSLPSVILLHDALKRMYAWHSHGSRPKLVLSLRGISSACPLYLSDQKSFQRKLHSGKRQFLYIFLGTFYIIPSRDKNARKISNLRQKTDDVWQRSAFYTRKNKAI